MATKSSRDTGTFSFTVEPLELRNLFRLLSALPKEVQDQVRTEAGAMSKRLAGQIQHHKQNWLWTQLLHHATG